MDKRSKKKYRQIQYNRFHGPQTLYEPCKLSKYRTLDREERKIEHIKMDEELLGKTKMPRQKS